MNNISLLPMVDWIGDYPVRHGERGRELDPVHEYACLCGEPDYMLCPNFDKGIQSLELSPPNGTEDWLEGDNDEQNHDGDQQPIGE